MISNKTYLSWHKKLEENSMLKSIVVFFGLYSLLLIYAAGLYLLVLGKYKELILLLVSFVLARIIINPLVFLVYKRQRPYQKLNFVPPHNAWLFSNITARYNSFPSDHAASFASIAAPLVIFFPLLGGVIIIIAIFNGLSRIVLGYHYISDILAGWLVGLLAAWVAMGWIWPIVLH
ncbi:MAG: phosphatase PAP2 family protein [Candidatus Doudnabacteria bacterium]|nr:phosphatase PAP2 family protein [Candidatus Doudnabacteria bacterium]